MSSVTVELRDDGIQELMKSAEMIACLQSYADSYAAQLGSGYETDTYIGTTRANVAIKAVSDQAKRDNLDNNTLLKVVGNE